MALSNPMVAAAFGPAPGLGNAPITSVGRSALDNVFGNVQGGFNTVFGTLGSTFGGDMRSQASSAAAFTSAMATGLQKPGDTKTWDFGATHGLNFEDVASSVARAGRMNIFGLDRQMLKSSAEDAASGDPDRVARATKIISTKASEVSDFMAAGRDVFGKDAQMEDIADGVKSVFGDSALNDPSKAAGLLRDLDSASQTLDLDAETVAKYISMMKAVAQNAGAIGGSASNGMAMSMISNVEGTVRAAGNVGVQVDRNVVAQNVADDAENYGGSTLSITGTVAQNFLEGLSEKDLLTRTTNIDGVEVSMARMKKEGEELARVMGDPNATPEQRAEAARKIGKWNEGMGKVEEVRDRVRDWDVNKEYEGRDAAERIARGDDIAGGQLKTGSYTAEYEDVFKNTTEDDRALLEEATKRGILYDFSSSESLALQNKWAEETGQDPKQFAQKLRDTVQKVQDQKDGSIEKAARKVANVFGDKTENAKVEKEIRDGSQTRKDLSSIYGESMTFDETGLSKAASLLITAMDKGEGFSGAMAAAKEEIGEGGEKMLSALALSSNEKLMSQMAGELGDLGGDSSQEDRDAIREKYLKMAADTAVSDTDGGVMQKLIEKARAAAAGSGEGDTPPSPTADPTAAPQGDGGGGGGVAGMIKDAGPLGEIFGNINQNINNIWEKLQIKFPG